MSGIHKLDLGNWTVNFGGLRCVYRGIEGIRFLVRIIVIKRGRAFRLHLSAHSSGGFGGGAISLV